MRVLHVCPYMAPTAGGPPVVVERYCQLSKEYGWESKLISTSLLSDEGGAELQQSLSARIDAEILPVDRSWLRGLSSNADGALNAGIRAADIVHLHTLWHPLGRLARKICRRHARPYVVMPHGMLDPHSLRMNRWRKRVYFQLVEKQVLKDAGRIIYTAPEELRLAVEQFPWLPPGVVSSLGVDGPPEIPHPQMQQAFLKQFPAASGKRVLLFLGRLHPKKGLERILNIMPSLIELYRDLLLIVVGTGEYSYVRRLYNAVQDKAVAEHVLFTGQLQNEAKWGAFACAQIFVLPSAQENFSISVAESLRIGLPVIITDRVNIWPHVTEAKAGIVVPFRDIDASLCQAIETMLENPSIAQEMGKRGAIFAAREFSWHDATKRIVGSYESVLASR